jgi:hypothetical protein
MSEASLRTLVRVLGVALLGVGCWIVVDASSFGESVASFDGFNTHDLRDFATFYLALGVVLIVVADRPAWRFPVLLVAALETAFHAINHAIDVADSDPAWLGPAELVVLLLATGLFAWLARVALRAQEDSAESESR